MWIMVVCGGVGYLHILPEKLARIYLFLYLFFTCSLHFLALSRSKEDLKLVGYSVFTWKQTIPHLGNGQLSYYRVVYNSTVPNTE